MHYVMHISIPNFGFFQKVGFKYINRIKAIYFASIESLTGRHLVPCSNKFKSIHKSEKKRTP